MHKIGKKLCSTPVRVNSGSTSLSISDIIPSTSDSGSQANAIRKKRTERVRANVKKRVIRKRKHRKFELAPKIKKAKRIESQTSDSEWEIQSSVEYNWDSLNKQDNGTVYLFKTPERVRDLEVERDYVLSPPFICPKERNLTAIENEAIDEEEILFLEENKIETNDIFPTFERSTVIKTYPPKKQEKWKMRSLVNKGSGDWLVDLKMPTANANLLWENYIREHSAELPQLLINRYIGRRDSWDEHDDKDNDADNSDILGMLNEETRQLLKRNKRLCKIKGSCSKRNEELPMVVQQVVYMSEDDELPSKSDTQRVTKRRRKFITIEDKYDHFLCPSDEDADLLEENGTQMTFNKFHAKSKMERNSNCGHRSQKTSKVKIKSMEEFQSVVYKRSDGNFGIILKN